MKLNKKTPDKKTPAGRTKDRIRGLVRKLEEQLEEEYRRDADDLIDPHGLALNMTRNFVMDLCRERKLLWESSVFCPGRLGK